MTLAAPAPSDVGDAPVALLEASLVDFEALLGAVRRHDVVVAQQLPAQLLRYIARMPIRYVADLYNPMMIEVLEAVGAGSAGTPRRVAKSVLAQCTVADLVICASEKQRDLWLGGMGMAGLVDVARYHADPTFRSFVDVVPFGLPEREPRRAAPVLKGVWPGIAADDRVLLWAGGVWRWLDALTPIRAVQRLREGGRPVHLVFLGTGRPALGDDVPIPTSAERGDRPSPVERGLEGVCGALQPRAGCPTTSAQAYLLEADLAVCAHHDHLEARFSFRTRVLDHFWAGLPSVVTGGDAMGDLIERRALGRAVDAEDDEAFAAACAALLDDDEAHAAAVEPRARDGARVPLEPGGRAAGALLRRAGRPAAAQGAAGRAGAGHARAVPRRPGRPARPRRPG